MKQLVRLIPPIRVQVAVCLTHALLLTFAGCSSPEATTRGRTADPHAATSFWKPYLLFVQAAPYPRLYVEVEAVEGVVPDDETLNRFRGFLAAHCAKPAGIQVVRDTIIPRDQARGLSPGALARKYLTGSVQDACAPATAFIYVLFFDTLLSRDAGTSSTRAIAATEAPYRKAKRAFPQAEMLPYPAFICADPEINGPMQSPGLSGVFGLLLQHEAGHLLGLGRNPAHAEGIHCREKSCLMYREYAPSDLLMREVWANAPGAGLVPQLRLCAKCEADARAYAHESRPANLHFVGPVLVRSEAGYQVLALPGRLKLIVGEPDDQDAWQFADEVRNEAAKPTEADVPIFTATVKPEARLDRVRLRETLRRARKDPYEGVRRAAASL